MKNILIVTALSKELVPIKKNIKKSKYKNTKIYFLSTGIGNYNMILNLTKFLLTTKNKIDFVVNIGVCGYKEKPIDFFQVARIKNLANNKELIVPNIVDFGLLHSILSSEEIINSKKLIKDENFVDMESYGFEIVSKSFNLPRLILKIPFDKIENNGLNYEYELAIKLLEEKIDYISLINQIIIYLDKIEKPIDFSYYFSQFQFTFSEKEIFKKKYFKYISIVNNDFKKFFEEKKYLDKKSFLKELEKIIFDNISMIC